MTLVGIHDREETSDGHHGWTPNDGDILCSSWGCRFIVWWQWIRRFQGLMEVVEVVFKLVISVFLKSMVYSCSRGCVSTSISHSIRQNKSSLPTYQLQFWSFSLGFCHFSLTSNSVFLNLNLNFLFHFNYVLFYLVAGTWMYM